jgi:uncharacterized protein
LAAAIARVMRPASQSGGGPAPFRPPRTGQPDFDLRHRDSTRVPLRACPSCRWVGRRLTVDTGTPRQWSGTYSNIATRVKLEVRATENRPLRCAAGLAVLVVWSAGCANRASSASDNASTREETVHFASGRVPLAGTLVLPRESGRHGAVVLFHGSGPEGRNLFMARWFGAQGVAALAYDKRGVGESGGDFRAVPFPELAEDGLAAIGYLKSRREIDARHIGVWGLSQGGWLAPLAASRSADVAFVIAVSGPAVTPGEQMLYYYASELRSRGVPEADIREATAVRRDVWAYMGSGEGYEKAKEEMDQARARRWYNEARTQRDDLFAPLPPPSDLRPDAPGMIWFRHEMNYDPVPALEDLRVPALFLFGDADWLVPVDTSVAVIRRTLTESGHRDFTIRVFPHVDHTMQLVGTGLDHGIDPEYLETMRTWLAARMHASR